ncbi:MAG: DNA-processing protein DprA [Patescibacteria group bacterium]
MPNFINDRQYLIGFSYFLKIGPVKLQKIEAYFSNLAAAFWASGLELEKAGLEPKLTGEFINWRRTFNLEAVLNELNKEKIKFITWHDENYPKLLLEIPAPPYILYYRGNLAPGGPNRLAVVGSRKHSAYAEKTINELLPKIIEMKTEIVSGLAKGVDSLAHQAALNFKGRTLAVLGSGLNAKNIYPTINRSLAENIIRNGGALISEFPPDTPPLKQNFPRRNRIISGICQATLIIEAPAKSGALITANYALEQNREVLTVPGNIFSEFSTGPNNLIKAGAKTITIPEDILEVFKLENYLEKLPPDRRSHQLEKKKFIPENENEKIIYALIEEAYAKNEKITTDELVVISKLDTATINSTLSMLELRGVAKNDGIGYALN